MAQDHGAATTQGHAVSIALSKLLDGATDPDNDALSVVSVSAMSTNGGAVVLGTNSVTYTPQPGFTGTDRFTFTVSDGQGGTDNAIVEVLVVSGSLPGQNLVALTPTAGGYLLRFAGIPGQSYEIQRTPTLAPANWSTLGTFVTPLHGIIEYEDTNPPQPTAFYRTTTP